MKFRRILLLAILMAVCPNHVWSWGFFGHKKINELAVYTLPPEILGLYKSNLHYIIEKSVQPDKRRYIDPKEAPRHYIDIDHYGDSAIYSMPHNWYEAAEIYSEDTLRSYGIVPWHILLLKKLLTEAFREKNIDDIIRISTDMGHYIADANVPLHTTENYNGQLSNQVGIHGLWESRLPELHFDSYNLFTGRAEYIADPSKKIWEHLSLAHYALDSVLKFEKIVSESVTEEFKYSFEKRGKTFVRVYSRNFCREYEKSLNGMVERQMKRAIKLLGSIWYTCWIDAGQPLLDVYATSGMPEENPDTSEVIPLRPHE